MKKNKLNKNKKAATLKHKVVKKSKGTKTKNKLSKKIKVTKSKKKITPKPKSKPKLKVKVIKKVNTKKIIKKTITSFPISPEPLKNYSPSNEKRFSGPTGIKPYKPAKDEVYMNPKQLEHFKNILNIWKEQLLSEMGRTVEHMKTNAANFPDPVDRASQEEEFNLELKTRERERRLIKKIDESLEKIQGGDYGFCFDCGAEIGIKRLEARPTATQCIECKTIAEIREKQTGG